MDPLTRLTQVSACRHAAVAHVVAAYADDCVVCSDDGDVVPME